MSGIISSLSSTSDLANKNFYGVEDLSKSASGVQEPRESLGDIVSYVKENQESFSGLLIDVFKYLNSLLEDSNTTTNNYSQEEIELAIKFVAVVIVELDDRGREFSGTQEHGHALRIFSDYIASDDTMELTFMLSSVESILSEYLVSDGGFKCVDGPLALLFKSLSDQDSLASLLRGIRVLFLNVANS